LESAARRAEVLLQRLSGQTAAFRALQQPALRQQPFLQALVSDQIRFRKELMVRSILESLATLQEDARVPHLVGELQGVSPLILQELLEREDWRDRLPASVFRALSAPGPVAAACELEVSQADTLHHLETLLQDRHPTIAAAALFLIAWLDDDRGRKLAAGLRGDSQPLLLRRTADCLLAGKGEPPALSACPDLEKRVVLASSDFFHRTYADTLDTLADRAEIRSYAEGEVITEAGDTCRELLLLIEGAAAVYRQEGNATAAEQLRAGQVLDELDVLTHSASETTIVAQQDGTRLLAIPVDSFDAMVDRDPDFARRVLELESRHLQQLMRSSPPAGVRS
jgi:CRP-like cAMP-binding protein